MGWISNFTHVLVVHCLGYLQLNLCCHSNSFTNNHTHSCTVLHGQTLHGDGRVCRFVVCVPVILKSWITLLDNSYVYMSTSPFLFLFTFLLICPFSRRLVSLPLPTFFPIPPFSPFPTTPPPSHLPIPFHLLQWEKSNHTRLLYVADTWQHFQSPASCHLQ